MIDSVTDQVAEVVKDLNWNGELLTDRKDAAGAIRYFTAARLIATLAAEVDARRDGYWDGTGSSIEYLSVQQDRLTEAASTTDALLAEVKRG